MAKKKSNLTIKKFQKTNADRCNKYIRPIEEWTPLEWGACAAGELGELCNYLKKVKRGSKKWNEKTKEEVGYEISDTMAYLFLLASLLEIDVEQVLIEKFNIVSDRWKCDVKL